MVLCWMSFAMTADAWSAMIVGLSAAGTAVSVATIGALTKLTVRWRASAVVDHVVGLALQECPAENRAEVLIASARLAESLVGEDRVAHDVGQTRTTAPMVAQTGGGTRMEQPL